MGPQRAPNANVTMIRRDLEALPQHALPAGYAIRPFASGDVQAWVAIQAAADEHNVITEGLFRGQFGDDADELARRLFFLVDRTADDAGAGAGAPIGSGTAIGTAAPVGTGTAIRTGTAIGTAAAWFDDTGRGDGFGRVHWLAVHPDHQGRGLAKPLLGHVCATLRELGHERAILTTSTARAPAIGLYLRFGFVPEIASAVDADAWRELHRSAPRLAPWLAPWLERVEP